MENTGRTSAVYESFHDVSSELKIFLARDSRCALHFHRKLEMVYVVSGTIRFTAGETDYTAGKDEILYAHHYCKHGYMPAPGYQKIVLLPPPELTTDFSAQLMTSSLPPVMRDREFNRTLKPLWKTLLKYNNPSPTSQETLVLKGYVNVLFGNLFAHYPMQTPDGGSKRMISEVLDYIDRHYNKPLSLDSIANAFGYNRCYFSKLWSAHVGENLTVYINHVRLQNFVLLAKTTPAPRIAELAYSCGFDSLTTFYRCFQTQYNQSPKAYFQSAE